MHRKRFSDTLVCRLLPTFLDRMFNGAIRFTVLLSSLRTGSGNSLPGEVGQKRARQKTLRAAADPANCQRITDAH